ncbi:signal peptidase I [Actinocrinis puniceicyclus]|uniref:Signal peptidase I n=1 Tax=Actinocrinis puniceicyclus TaxID=977794 RepID=A0A8J7WIW1_9ACTN|nr:signal peptidase I [Actinocrinis puniceicyclus]MBS2963041.1 signal peptidase I [Actinocrinis puniceicyclus]
MARRVLTLVVRGRGAQGGVWGEAVLREFDETVTTWQALRWAAGGIRVAMRERRRRAADARRAGARWRRVSRRIVIGSATAAAVLAVLNQFVVTIAYEPSAGMQPTLRAGSRIIVDRISLHFGGLSRGDLVQISLPTPAGRISAFKRVVGLPGDQISCRDGFLIRNGVRVDEPYLPAGSTIDCRALTVPAHEVYVLGDNRAASADSRIWGPVAERDITGRVLVFS